MTPRHVAIIMDGNRRWARERRLPVIEGHRRGMVALREITGAASDAGVEILTVYGFSTENWKREATEISLLLDLAVYFARHELDELCRNNVRVEIIGHYEALPRASREALDGLRARTAANTGVLLNLAVNYSSREELRDAVQAIARDVRDGKLAAEAIDEDKLAAYLYTARLPDPELLIRPGGEWRLSNFLLYQLAKSEIFVTETYWPDFTREHFIAALDAYAERRTATPS